MGQGHRFEIVSTARLGPRPDVARADTVSVVIPAFQAERTLPQTVASVRSHAPAGTEVVIVDDGSFDATPEVARRLADRFVQRPCQGGAARSRNDGARVASGDILVFVDADVTVTAGAIPGAIERVRAGADAVFGAYTALPPDEVRTPSTDYKNLLHHYTHLRGAGEAATFWSGFGVVRRAAFEAVHGFDPAVTNSADVEDIHLGYRLRGAGYRIVLDPTLQVRHHKQYSLRGMLDSDLRHRAIPWTRAMFELRTFGPDLNLRQSAMAAAALVYGVVAGLVLAPVEPMLVGVSAVLAAIWVVLNLGFIRYAFGTLGLRGGLSSTGLLALYHLYGPVGVALGLAAFLLRHGHEKTLNRLHLEIADPTPGPIDASVAVIVQGDEEAVALDGLPPLDPSWELLVVGSLPPERLPEGARFLPCTPGASRNEMRDAALRDCRGEMLAILDAACVPVDGWLARVRAAARRNDLVVGGPFAHDRASTRRRANQVVRFWEWRPERQATWLVDHPNTNLVVRAEVARELGGFAEEGALILRLAGFGARPVRHDPDMGVELHAPVRTARFVRGVMGVSRLRAAAVVRYMGIGRPYRVLLAITAPFGALLRGVGQVRQAVSERSADASYWRAFPLVMVALLAAAFGRSLGLLRPGTRGGALLHVTDDPERAPTASASAPPAPRP